MNSKLLIKLFIKIFGKSLSKTTLGVIFLFILVIGFYFISYADLGSNHSSEKPFSNSYLDNSERRGPYKVIKVVDGDTIDILIDNSESRIRLIGVNTPETVDPRKSVECFGLQASDYTKSTLDNKNIYIERDLSQGETDKYGRLLAYVFLEDGSFLNLNLIKEGYAYEYTYQIPYKYQSEFQEAQKSAQEEKKGLWGDDSCLLN